MKMGKPTSADIAAAGDLLTLLFQIDSGAYPCNDEHQAVPDRFDENDPAHLRAFYDAVRGTLEQSPGYEGRVIGGMCHVIMHEPNGLIDPNSTTIDLHPRLVKALEVSEQAAKIRDVFAAAAGFEALAERLFFSDADRTEVSAYISACIAGAVPGPAADASTAESASQSSRELHGTAIETGSGAGDFGQLAEEVGDAQPYAPADAAGEQVAPAFLEDLARSRAKYPRNSRMLDGLLGEVHELKRAYHGDGDVRGEALDVAVCAYRIAVEGDAGGNLKLDSIPDAFAWGAQPGGEAIGQLAASRCTSISDAGAIRSVGSASGVAAPAAPDALTHCAASRDGDCSHALCPQLRDNEPRASGRHCPLDGDGEGES